jgi:hypothetical protein
MLGEVPLEEKHMRIKNAWFKDRLNHIYVLATYGPMIVLRVQDAKVHASLLFSNWICGQILSSLQLDPLINLVSSDSLLSSLQPYLMSSSKKHLVLVHGSEGVKPF